MPARKPALAFIFVTLFLDILGIGLIIPILPKLIEQFEGGSVTAAANTFGLLAALYGLMQFVCAPVLGNLSDRFGRRPVILASLFGSGLDYLLLAFAPNLGWFFFGRIVAGITSANFTAATAYIADISPPEKRAQNFGMIGVAFGLGFIAGPALGGLIGNIGLRMPFLVAAGLTLLNWLYGLLVLPESLAPENCRAFDWRRANPVGSLLALRRHPMVLGLTGAYFLLYLAHQVLPATWVLYTSHRYAWTVGQIGASLATVGVTAAVVQGGLTRAIIPALGEQRSVILGLGIGGASYVAYGLATQGWMIYAIIAIGSLGGICGPALQGLVSRSVGANEQGAVQGALTSLASVAGIIGPPIATGLFSHFISDSAPVRLPGAAFFFSGLLNLGAIFMAMRSFRRRDDSAPMETAPASMK
ncbi:MAG: TCR/Tet family MFS transporter [Verrucomicrobia bacterium]|nr:TCR/Tet family MFS transporter [Verrucomicrobiota bacterium]